MALEGRNIDPLIHNKSLIEKTYEIDKSLMYILMRKDKIFDGMSENIDKEIKPNENQSSYSSSTSSFFDSFLS